jgi:hypothetical protein
MGESPPLDSLGDEVKEATGPITHPVAQDDQMTASTIQAGDCFDASAG